MEEEIETSITIEEIENELTLKESSITLEEGVEKVVNKKTTKQAILATTSTSTATVSTQRELKTIFILSSHGNKSPKSKLKDCCSLFETLYEKNEQIKSTLNDLVSQKKYNQIKKFDFKFDLYKFEFTNDQINLSIFGNRYSTIKMVIQEQAELKKQNYDKYWIFDVWRGNLVKLIDEIQNQNGLNDFLVLLSHLSLTSNQHSNGSIINNYIQSLQKGKLEQINKAALISLASYNLDQAIQIYLSNNLFQYALCLAQIRLSPNSDLFYHVLEKYASYTAHNGDYETAAMCFIRMSDFENAYKILSRRDAKNDLETEKLTKYLLNKLEFLLQS